MNYPTPEREMAYKHSSIVSREYVNGKRIMTYQSSTGSKKILLVHGWSGRATQFYQMAPLLIQAGYKVHAFTAPAHGQGTEKQTHMMEFADSIIHMENNHGPFEAIIAHSIGAAAAMRAHVLGVKTKTIVALGAPGKTEEIVADFCDRLGFIPTIQKRLIDNLKVRYGNDIEQFSFPSMAERSNISGLLVHDKTDQDVPVEVARRNHKLWKNSQYIETDGLGHQRILSNPGVIEKIITYLNKTLV